MDGLTGEGLLIIVVITLTIWAGEEAVQGAKWVGHQTKCGMLHVVGKHCDPPPEDDQP